MLQTAEESSIIRKKGAPIMLQSERIELAIYHYVKSVGSLRSTTIGELAAAVRESREDLAERLRYLYSEGHAKLGKYARPAVLPKWEHSFQSTRIPITESLEIKLIPLGRKYLERRPYAHLGN